MANHDRAVHAVGGGRSFSFRSPCLGERRCDVRYGNVDAFELMKLRLLNGSHSTLAYLGYLAGHETVSDVMKADGLQCASSKQ